MVMGALREKTEVVVIGAGPGGYVAALRAADLGKEVILVEPRERRGGVCLIEGCIPSKALIHAVEVVETAREAKTMGVTFKDPAIDRDVLRKWKESVVDSLTKGVDVLLKRRGVEVVQGRARFESAKSLAIEGTELSATDVAAIDFKHCIIATGSRVATIPMAGDLPIWNSTEALNIPSVPPRLLVVGGGYIGLELGLVYAGLGSQVTVVEMMPTLLPGVDADLVAVLARSCEKRFTAIHLSSRVAAIEKTTAGYAVTIEKDGKKEMLETDQVLVSIGRKPNTDNIGLEKTKIVVERGVIQVDEARRTAIPNIYAIGDITAGPMLAHKASREGKVAAEVIAGHPAAFDNRAIPAVIYTDPEVAWTGMTENEAAAAGMKVNVGKFPFAALGRSKTLSRTDGFVKILNDPATGLIVGCGAVGVHASELIAEVTLAIEMGATLEDLAATIHPHPTLSEAVMQAAEVALGTAVDINPPREKKAPEPATAGHKA